MCMATGDEPEEITVSDRGVVTIPASLRHRLDIEPRDKIRWEADSDGIPSVEVVKQQYEAFDGDDLKAPMGGDGKETHDLAGHERDPAFTEDS